MRLTQERIDELKAKNFPVANYSTFGIVRKDPEGELDESTRIALESIDRYLSIFCVPPKKDPSKGEEGGFAVSNQLCPGCDRSIGGLLGSFTWGIAHGEGHCSRCGYPHRGIHYVKTPDGLDIFTGGVREVLPYHPSRLEIKRDEEDNSYLEVQTKE